MSAWKPVAFVGTAFAVAYAAFNYGSPRIFMIMVVSGSVVGAFQYFQRRAAKSREGWRYLTPSPSEWFCFIAVPVFVVFLSCVYFFVGSGRPDAAYQMLMLKIMIVAFSLGGILVTYLSFGIVTRWNDDRVQQTAVGRRSKDILVSDIAFVQFNPLWQSLRIESFDGSIIWAGVSHNGTDELIEFLIEKLQPPEQDIAGTEAENDRPSG